jgi:hypothetical protein
VWLADRFTNHLELTVETFMHETLYAPERGKLPWPDATAERERKSLARSSRLARRTIGFWLGAALLGTGGCILGACMPYHRPVAVVISVLWWGLYFGCFGGSIGALLGLWAEPSPVPPLRKLAGDAGGPARESAPTRFPEALLPPGGPG